MKRLWAWLSDLFVSEPAAVTVTHRPIAIAVDTPDAPWTIHQVSELRWA